MLSSLANYLLGSGVSGGRESGDDGNVESYAVMTRVSQVEVEGDEWILIDRTVEGATALEESWYVTPPACFTRAGPVNVETSPLENLLIEHPSMSVYRASAPPHAPDTPPPTPDSQDDRADELDDEFVFARSRRHSDDDDDHEDHEDEVNDEHHLLVDVYDVSPSRQRDESRRRHHHRRRRPCRHPAAEEAPTRRPAIHDGRPQRLERNGQQIRLVQLRSAQKVLEKRSSQGLKRGRLERSNKLREVFSVKGKRPRRQDRLRVQNSGANNNRKC